MTTWFTADQHFGHKNISAYCKRPFILGGIQEMNEVLVRRWNEVVSSEDTVYHLGDICMGDNPERMKHIPRLNGHKILYPGNHDSCWIGRSQSANKRQLYFDAGFEHIVPGEGFVKLGNYEVKMHHFPYIGDSHDEDRFNEFRPFDDGDWLLHGHIHDKWKVNGRMINIGVDVWDFYPVHESTLIDIIEDNSE